MTKTILIIAENKEGIRIIEDKLTKQISFISGMFNNGGAEVKADGLKVKIVTKDSKYDTFAYDEVHDVTEESMLSKLLDKEYDSAINSIVGGKDDDKDTLDLQSQNLKLHQEIAELQQEIIDTHLKNFDEKRQESAVNSFGESLINLIKNDDTSLDEKVDDLFDTYKDYIKFIKGILDNK